MNKIKLLFFVLIFSVALLFNSAVMSDSQKKVRPELPKQGIICECGCKLSLLKCFCPVAEKQKKKIKENEKGA